MKIENEFRVSSALEETWEILTDIPTIAPCMPGAKLTSVEDETYSGKVKIKVGPVTAEYSGTAHFLSKDDAAHRAELSAKGRDSRGSGNAEAVIVAQLTADADGTLVNIDTDLKVSGKVAQFGRGVMVDVSKKLIGQFVECLEDKIQDMQGTTIDDVAEAGAAIAESDADVVAPPAATAATTEAPSPADAAPAPTAGAAATESSLPGADEEVEALDLMEYAGGAMAKRVVPLVVALIVAIILYLIFR